jgi:hypothetical protein
VPMSPQEIPRRAMMVIVIFSRSGYEDMKQLIAAVRCTVWVNADVISATEINGLRSAGIDLTTFSDRINPSDGMAIESAVAIVCEHHPGGRLWVELQSAPAE